MRHFLLLTVVAAGVFTESSTCFALGAAVDTIRADFMWQQGYTGTGVEIGVIDLFLADSSHPAISENFLGSQKFVNGASFQSNHATSVVGAAVSRDAQRRGVAFDAGWWTAQTTNPGSITTQRRQTIAAETFAGNHGLDVLSLSIGLTGTDTATDQWSQALDHIAFTLGTTIVVAAGNDGPASSSFTGPPGAAFNIISVGATGGTGGGISDDYGQIAPYSSRGPTSDGRAKPDLVAPGSLIELPILGDTWAEGSGTSFATPLVAGGAALLVDMGRDRGMSTDALVIKSVLMNSADKLPGWSHTSITPLDANLGAGQMNLETAFYQYDAGEQTVGSVSAAGWDLGSIVGGDNTYEIAGAIPAGTPLAATLVWNRAVTTDTEDIEDVIYTATPLANLDLFLYETGDAMTPVAQSISAVDNVELLSLSIPSSGNYALAVRAADGSLIDPVSYSLAWNVAVAPIVLLGDYNEDGAVNAADYTVYRHRKAGIGGTTLPNDAGASGVTIEDYLYWKAHYGETLGSGSSLVDPTTNVPEPAALVLCLLAVAILSAGRRRN
jgi:hypothetical protein